MYGFSQDLPREHIPTESQRVSEECGPFHVSNSKDMNWSEVQGRGSGKEIEFAPPSNCGH